MYKSILVRESLSIFIYEFLWGAKSFFLCAPNRMFRRNLFSGEIFAMRMIGITTQNEGQEEADDRLDHN